ncbi:MAG: tRNA pseudouridine(38-40) synthase TruA [Spirochaetes bacterium]|nr:tRNA pseudouridine(38-40) synthase TruA [Spirochaetota bacterium]
MKKRNIKLTISYEGTNYYGFKSQLSGNTIENELLKVINKITSDNVKIICAGRTDRGVHAEGQVINFFTDKLNLTEINWLNALNTYLPDDIRILKCEFCDPYFNARKSAFFREYRYQLVNSQTISALSNRFAALYKKKLNIELLREYAKYLTGEHDFTSFCASSDENATKTRFIHTFEINKDNDLIRFKIIGNAFLHKMIRNIIGTMIFLNKNNMAPDEIKKILDAKDRNIAGPTFTPKGLIFYKVYYTKNMVD